MKTHPCLSCGACCAFYRVSFHWSETMAESHGVPLELTKSSSLHKSVMNGTNEIKPSCVALLGVVGKSTSCSIYENRPSTCRTFKPSYEDGMRNQHCESARESKGLEVLTFADYA